MLFLFGATAIACSSSRLPDQQLFTAINTGYYQGAVAALTAGASPNAKDVDGNTALHNAAAFNRIDIASLLTDAGASVDARRGLPFLGMAETPLMWAAKHNSFGVAKLLLERGASRGAFLFYGTAAGFARASGRTEMSEFISSWTPERES